MERMHTRCRGEIRTRDEQPVLSCGRETGSLLGGVRQHKDGVKL